MLRMLAFTASRTFAGTPIGERARVAVPLRRATTKAAAAPPPAGDDKETHTKKALVAIVADELKMTKTDVERVIDSTLNTIMKSVAKGEKIQIIGFGTFEARARAAREGRNPSTGEAIKIAATTSPAFVAGKKFKDIVKGVDDKPAPAKKAAAPKK